MALVVVCFILFFGVGQLFPLLDGFHLSAPMFAGLGVLLAIASNSKKGMAWQSWLKGDRSSSPIPPAAPIPSTSQTVTPLPPMPAMVAQPLNAQPLPPKPKGDPKLPPLQSLTAETLSFTIRKKRDRNQTWGKKQ
jgi:hypothetical protein